MIKPTDNNPIPTRIQIVAIVLILGGRPRFVRTSWSHFAECKEVTDRFLPHLGRLSGANLPKKRIRAAIGECTASQVRSASRRFNASSAIRLRIAGSYGIVSSEFEAHVCLWFP